VSISCKHVSFEYTAPGGAVLALDDVTFSVDKEEFICIVGPSGCGKTTLLKIIAGLLKPISGEIKIEAPQSNAKPHNAMVFQEHGLFPWMSVLDNVSLGLQFRGVERGERQTQSMAFIEQFGLSEFTHRFPHELSVGMRQRVSLARAFVMDPDVLLMDEPFASLDALTKVVLQEQLLRIWKDSRKQVIYITHDIEEALLLGDRVLVMTGRPASIREEIKVPLARPRQMADRIHPEIISRKEQIWELLELEVRKSIRRPV
jgi:NitT/TauT family transport system ATP-binding protein